MAPTGFPFVILKQVDSTNNYAMGKVHAGMAKHGDGWYSEHQTQGKGQRGKAWVAVPGTSIALSIVFNPRTLQLLHPFQLSAAVALGAYDVFSRYAGEETTIKWPNDIYWRDRKAGGILIENKFSGNLWTWAVAGIGLNINQALFDPSLPNPVSLLQITGSQTDLLPVAQELYDAIFQRAAISSPGARAELLTAYNHHLYKRGQQVRFRQANRVFETTLTGVNAHGQLMTTDVMDKLYDFGELEWLI